MKRTRNHARSLRCQLQLLLAFLFIAGTLIGIRIHSGRLQAEDGPVLIAQTGQPKKQKAEPSKPKTASPKKSAVEEAAEDDGPSKAAPPMEHETIKLADGTEIQVEKWGDTFEAYEYQPPVDLDHPNVEEIVWYKNVGGGGPVNLFVDSKSSKLYWAEGHGGHPNGRIVRSNLDGKQLTSLVDGLLKPRDLVVDTAHNRMFWLEGVKRHALKTAELTGKGTKTVLDGLRSPFGLALDTVQGDLYFWDEPGRIISVKTDGTDEQKVVGTDRDPMLGHWPRGMCWNSVDKKLYWLGPSSKGMMIRRVDPANPIPEDLFKAHSGNDQMHFALDAIRGRVAFPNRTYGQLVIANLDGSERQLLVTSVPKTKVNPKGIGSSVAFDQERRTIYWSASHYDGSSPYASIFRMTLPPPLRRHSVPPPPVIIGISPDTVRESEKVAIRGKYLSKTSRLTVVDDSTGKLVPVTFNVESDTTVSLTVPKLGDNCVHPVFILETTSGITVTLKKDCHTISPNRPWIHDRLGSERMPQLWLMPGSEAASVEAAVIYANAESQLTVGPRGQSVVFLKSGAFYPSLHQPNCTIFHEPFPVWGAIQEMDAGVRLVAVSSIRPSFIEKAVTYKN